MQDIVPLEAVTRKIILLRGVKVMLDRDLAELYAIETKYLKRQVRRNIERFPEDFMFELSKEEFQNWRCQFGTSNSEKMGLRHPPMAFTEQGVAMLSSVLKSERAIQVNILIMRAFTKLRQLMATYEDLKRKLEEMEANYDEQFRIVFEAIKQLLDKDEQPGKKIGFLKEESSNYS
jgi:hypothetical protein